MNFRTWFVELLRTTNATHQQRTRSGFIYRGIRLHRAQYISHRYISDYHVSQLDGVIQNLRHNYEGLQEATKEAQVDEIAMHWSQVRRILMALPEHLRKDISKNKLQIDDATLVDASGVLAKRGNARDAQILVELLTESPRMLESSTSADMLKNVLGGLVRAKQSVKAYDLLRTHHRYSTPGFRPNSTHFYTVMCGLRKIGDIQRLKECIRIMKSGWPHPNVTHYRQIVWALLSHPFSGSDTVTELKAILDDLASMKLPYDKDIFDALKAKPELSELADQYGAAPRGMDKALQQQWIQGLQFARKKGKNPFQQKLKQFRSEGFVPDVYSLSKIVDGSGVSTLEELTYLRDLLEVEPNVVVWSVVLKNVLNKRDVSKAIELYEVARASGIRPDSRMVHPILTQLCNGRFTEPSEKNIDRALQIYADLVGLEPDKTIDGEESNLQIDADIAIYNTLLRALTSHSNKQKYLSRAFSLLEDMRRRHLSMDAMTVTSITILLMRSASSYSSAYAAYGQIRSLKGVSLDAEAYAAILHAYCNLEIPGSFPSAKHYFSIINDMHAAGIPKSERIYTILLGRYAYYATRLKDVTQQEQPSSWKSQDDLLAAIQDTHHQLTLDASVTPDAPLWNQLMDAYNRIGHFKGVLDVWTILNSTGMVTNASVSVVLDACGFRGDYETARSIFASLQSSGFPLNKRNWNSWIECLARLGRLDEALRVAFEDMSKTVRPDGVTVQILVSFAVREGRAEQICSLINLQLPDAWTAYKELRASSQVR